jgi:hypothetical protein
MSQYHSLQAQLQQLLTTLPPAKPKPPPGSAPEWTSYSDELPPAAAERLRCARCKGTGLLGGSMIAAVDEEPWPCPSCRGKGFCCPTCRDMRWLRTDDPGQAGQRPIKPCPDCPTPEQRWATIERYICDARAAMAPPA